MGAVDVAAFLAKGGDLEARIKQADKVAPVREAGEVYVTDGETWEATRNGPRRLAPYALRFTEDVASPDGRQLAGMLLGAGRDRPFTMPAEVLGDPRALRKLLAGALGSSFRAPRGKLELMADAWLEASTVEQREVGHDYGFTDDGAAFVDADFMLPDGTRRFGPGPASAAARLRLRDGEARETAAMLLDVWPEVLGCPTTCAALMGVVGWGLVAPVLEARDRSVSPLLAFLHGPSGAGKSTHAGIVQCFFGDYAASRAAVSFSSTPLSIELEGHLFRGAVMVVGDVKVSAIADGGAAKVLGLIQRAGDRAERRRLNHSGQAQQSKRSRATWLFEGEDVPVTEGSALARLLVLPLPVAPRQPHLVNALLALMPDLSAVTLDLVRYTLEAQPWERLLAQYTALVPLLTALSDVPNAARLARSIAAVACGLQVWLPWLEANGLDAPASVQEVVDGLIAATASQLDAVSEATPGETFLELLRQLLASGAARIGEGGGVGELIGEWHRDQSVAYILPEPTLGRIRRHLPEAAGRLAPAGSIAADLVRTGAIVETDSGRRTKKRRIGGHAANTWALDGGLVA